MTSLFDRFSPARIPAQAERLRGQVKVFFTGQKAQHPAEVSAKNRFCPDTDFNRALAIFGRIEFTLRETASGGASIAPVIPPPSSGSTREVLGGMIAHLMGSR